MGVNLFQYKTLWVFFKSVSSPFQVRYKSVLTPILRMGGEKTHDTDERFCKVRTIPFAVMLARRIC